MLPIMATYHKRLTNKFLEKNIKAPKGQDEYYDKTFPGFAVRIGISGRKSFTLMYRYGGKAKRLTLGRYPKDSLADAKDKARNALNEVEKGNDPALIKKAVKEKRLTFKQLSDQYIERHAKRHKRTWRGDQSIIENKLNKWHERNADSITRQDVISVFENLVDHDKPVMANRTLALIRYLFKWGTEKGLISVSPVVNIKREPERERDRVLSDDEIKSLWAAFGVMGYPFGDCFKLLLILGQRRGETAGMEKPNVNLKDALWTLPARVTKSKRSHECPLSDLAIEIIQGMPDIEGDYFLTTTGRSPISGFSVAKAELDKLSKVTDWRLHDLRRTVGTNLARLGIADSTISRVLNHEEGGVTRIYKRYSYLPEKREALDMWAERLKGIISGEETDKVAQLHSIKDADSG